ncbi:hypothetical protein Hdeb2414_s0007g00256141 [Helianthus debilis subsp. tardiflorus]
MKNRTIYTLLAETLGWAGAPPGNHNASPLPGVVAWTFSPNPRPNPSPIPHILNNIFFLHNSFYTAYVRVYGVTKCRIRMVHHVNLQLCREVTCEQQ